MNICSNNNTCSTRTQHLQAVRQQLFAPNTVQRKPRVASRAGQRPRSPSPTRPTLAASLQPPPAPLQSAAELAALTLFQRALQGKHQQQQQQSAPGPELQQLDRSEESGGKLRKKRTQVAGFTGLLRRPASTQPFARFAVPLQPVQQVHPASSFEHHSQQQQPMQPYLPHSRSASSLPSLSQLEQSNGNSKVRPISALQSVERRRHAQTAAAAVSAANASAAASGSSFPAAPASLTAAVTAAIEASSYNFFGERRDGAAADREEKEASAHAAAAGDAETMSDEVVFTDAASGSTLSQRPASGYSTTSSSAHSIASIDNTNNKTGISALLTPSLLLRYCRLPGQHPDAHIQLLLPVYSLLGVASEASMAIVQRGDTLISSGRSNSGTSSSIEYVAAGATAEKWMARPVLRLPMTEPQSYPAQHMQSVLDNAFRKLLRFANGDISATEGGIADGAESSLESLTLDAGVSSVIAFRLRDCIASTSDTRSCHAAQRWLEETLLSPAAVTAHHRAIALAHATNAPPPLLPTNMGRVVPLPAFRVVFLFLAALLAAHYQLQEHEQRQQQRLAAAAEAEMQSDSGSSHQQQSFVQQPLPLPQLQLSLETLVRTLDDLFAALRAPLRALGDQRLQEREQVAAMAAVARQQIASVAAPLAATTRLAFTSTASAAAGDATARVRDLLASSAAVSQHMANAFATALPALPSTTGPVTRLQAAAALESAHRAQDVHVQPFSSRAERTVLRTAGAAQPLPIPISRSVDAPDSDGVYRAILPYTTQQLTQPLAPGTKRKKVDAATAAAALLRAHGAVTGSGGSNTGTNPAQRAVARPRAARSRWTDFYEPTLPTDADDTQQQRRHESSKQREQHAAEQQHKLQRQQAYERQRALEVMSASVNLQCAPIGHSHYNTSAINAATVAAAVAADISLGTWSTRAAQSFNGSSTSQTRSSASLSYSGSASSFAAVKASTPATDGTTIAVTTAKRSLQTYVSLERRLERAEEVLQHRKQQRPPPQSSRSPNQTMNRSGSSSSTSIGVTSAASPSASVIASPNPSTASTTLSRSGSNDMLHNSISNIHILGSTSGSSSATCSPSFSDQHLLENRLRALASATMPVPPFVDTIAEQSELISARAEASAARAALAAAREQQIDGIPIMSAHTRGDNSVGGSGSNTTAGSGSTTPRPRSPMVTLATVQRFRLNTTTSSNYSCSSIIRGTAFTGSIHHVACEQQQEHVSHARSARSY